MNGTAFKLATLAKADGNAFVAIVLGDDAIDLKALHAAYRARGAQGRAEQRPTACSASWRTGTRTSPCCRRSSPSWKRKARLRARRSFQACEALPPVRRPGKMFYAAQNFQEHVNEMIRAGMSPSSGPVFTGEKSTTVPYLFLKAPSCLAGAFDDIEIPRGMKKIDWEAEIALAIGKARQADQGRAGARPCRGLHDHQRRVVPRSADPHRSSGAALGLARRQEPRQFRADGAVSRAARFRARPHEPVHPASPSTAR